jgi:hypothetical protein
MPWTTRHLLPVGIVAIACRGTRCKSALRASLLPDLNPIEQAFGRLKAHLRKAAERTVDRFWTAIGQLLDRFSPLSAPTVSPILAIHAQRENASATGEPAAGAWAGYAARGPSDAWANRCAKMSWTSRDGRRRLNAGGRTLSPRASANAANSAATATATATAR